MKNILRIAQWGIAAAAAVVMLAPAGARADVFKCQTAIDKAVQVLETKIFDALEICKNEARKEQLNGTLSGLGTDCGKGACKISAGGCRGNADCAAKVCSLATGTTCTSNTDCLPSSGTCVANPCVFTKSGGSPSKPAGCMATAAKKCEAALCKIYGQVSPTCPNTTNTQVKVFRSAIQKAFTTPATNPPCTTADIAYNTSGKNSLQHLLSGNPTSPLFEMAPPLSGATYQWMTDFLLFAVEKYTIKKQLMTVSDMFALFQEMQGASAGLLSATSVASQKGTSCSGNTANFNTSQREYRPNLCTFGIECRDHVCTLDTTGQDCGDNGGAPCDASRGFCGNGFGRCSVSNPNGCPGGGDDTCYPECGGACDPSQNLTDNGSYVDIATTSGLTLTLPVFGSLAMEVCKAGRIQGRCKLAPATPCQSNDDCTLANDLCNLTPGEGAGMTFGTQSFSSPLNQTPSFLYLINQPSKTIYASVVGSPLEAFIKGVCVGVERSEGWCDCTGAGLPINVTACQQRVTTTSPDSCGATVDPNNGDPDFPGTVNGALTLSMSGSSQAGDCLDLVQVSLGALLETADLGPDGLACTGDDFAAATPPLAFPLTTGLGTANLFQSPTATGACNGGSRNGEACLEAANCPGGTCNGAVLGNFNKSKSGAKTSCANYMTSNLSGVGLAGAIPLAGLIPASIGLGDVVAAFHFGCK